LYECFVTITCTCKNEIKIVTKNKIKNEGFYFVTRIRANCKLIVVFVPHRQLVCSMMKVKLKEKRSAITELYRFKISLFFS